MSTVLDPSTLSASELAALQEQLAKESARREQVAAFAAEFARATDAIRRVVGAHPPVAFDPVPQWEGITGHPPGQHVIFEGVEYVNVGDCFLDVEPLTTIDWAVLEPETDVPLTPLEPAEPLEPSPEQLPSLGEEESS